MENKTWGIGDRAFYFDPNNYIEFDEIIIKSEPYAYEASKDKTIEVVKAKSVNSFGTFCVMASRLYATKEEALSALADHRSMYKEELREKLSVNIYDLCEDLISALEDMEDSDRVMIDVYREQLNFLKNKKE